MGQNISVSPSSSRRGSLIRHSHPRHMTPRGSLVSPLSPAAQQHARQVVACPVPPRLPELLATPPCEPAEQAKHAWSASDCSPNLFVMENDPLTLHRHPIAQSTDICRSRQGYKQGLHVWQITWPSRQRGTHAVVGVCQKEAPVQAAGYVSLLGANELGYGWDLSRNKARHSNSQPRTYPQLQQAEPDKSGSQSNNNSSDEGSYAVPDTFYMVLDMELGTLGFVADGRWLGQTFSGLRGKELYPAVSCVWGHAQIRMKYLNGLKPAPLSLKELCRTQIRSHLGEENLDLVQSLPLPSIIKSYVLYRSHSSILLSDELQQQA